MEYKENRILPFPLFICHCEKRKSVSGTLFSTPSPNFNLFVILEKHWPKFWNSPRWPSLWCDMSLLISQGGPKRQADFLPGGPSTSAVVSVPHLHLMSWLFSLSGTPQSLHFPWATMGSGFFAVIFSNEGDTSTSRGAHYSLNCSVSQFLWLPLYVSESSSCSLVTGIHTVCQRLL